MQDPVKIGNVKIEGKLVLAPMVAVNCPAFRLLCREYGAALVYTPMIHATGLVEMLKNGKEDNFKQELDVLAGERPISMQLVGRDPTYLAEATRFLDGYADIIDINFGCPEVKVLANKIECKFAVDGSRRVNIDPGYMDFHKLVLASVKFLGQKIYLGKGVYADPTLYYDKGWKPYDWGFPDFRDGRYNDFLTLVRRAYRQKLRRLDSAQTVMASPGDIEESSGGAGEDT